MPPRRSAGMQPMLDLGTLKEIGRIIADREQDRSGDARQHVLCELAATLTAPERDTFVKKDGEPFLTCPVVDREETAENSA